MKKKVKDLEGAELNSWVAEAEGIDTYIAGGTCYIRGAYTEGRLGQSPKGFCPTYNWNVGGPIIEREEIDLEFSGDKKGQCLASRWFSDKKDIDMFGPTPLIAAMRAYVASKYGEEVEE